jgi:hypothetical protein
MKQRGTRNSEHGAKASEATGLLGRCSAFRAPHAAVGLLVASFAAALLVWVLVTTGTAAPIPSDPPAEKCKYPWLAKYDSSASVTARIPEPAKFHRLQSVPGDFADWCRRLPLRPPGTPVKLFDGRPSPSQDNHAAVIDIDTGTRDLQQCADAVIRLRAEYLYSVNRFEDIHFNFTSGDRADFTKWAAGDKPSVKGSTVAWVRGAAPGTGHASFRSYLDMVFTYAGTVSLAKELKPVEKIEDMQVGDVFIHPGSPGHAALVIDVAMQPGAGKRIFLLAQGFMPAQDIHILKNLKDPALSPWFATDFGDKLETPSWTFEKTDLMRF